MITKRERKKIKKVLGNDYSPLVSEELSKCGVFTRNGDAYSHSMIRRVFNGYEHDAIEKAIFSAVETKYQEDLEEKERRDAILDQRKTGAVTPA